MARATWGGGVWTRQDSPWPLTSVEELGLLVLPLPRPVYVPGEDIFPI